MKLRAPDGCTSVSHDGRSYCVAADGSLEVEESVAAALAAHGFAPWAGKACAEPRRGAAEPRESFAADDAVDAGSSGIDIESLNRPALFALLRDKGVRVSLPVSNAELRQAARRALTRKP